jgi:diguanylate cyclase (GGDEF)-like protein/PAS domain S-box-containing protein
MKQPPVQPENGLVPAAPAGNSVEPHTGTGPDEFRVLLDSSQGFVAVVEGGRFVFANRAALSLLGVEQAASVIGTDFMRYVHPDDFAAIDVGSHAASGNFTVTPIRIVRADGIVLQVELTISEVIFRGRVAHAYLALDRTQELQAISALSAREGRILKILDAMIDGVITVDDDGYIESFNKAAEDIFGFRAGSVIGQSVEPLLRPAPRMILHDTPHASLPPAAGLTAILETLAKGEFGGLVTELKRRDGTNFVAELSMSELKHLDRQIYCVIVRDVTERKRFEQTLERLALEDTLTGLPNRLHLVRMLDDLTRAETPQTGAVILFDLDRFKNINDFFGHSFGDTLIQSVAERFSPVVAPGEFLSRLPGDEFVLVSPGAGSAADVDAIVKRFSETLKRPFLIDDFELFMTISAGAILYPDQGSDSETILKRVESAAYFAKDSGRNHCQIYSAKISEGRAERLDLESELRKALRTEAFFLAYQPRVDLRTGAVHGMEALIRWSHPRLGRMSPGSFINVAEETGLIVPIGDLVLEAACQTTNHWIERGLGPLIVSVNLSTRQFRDAGLVGRIESVLDRTGLPASCLEIEITESGLMFEIDRVLEVLADLKDLGVSIAVDDFGTGYSSLSYLKRFPIDVLKIDQSFVRGLPDEPDDVAISTAIVAMAKSLKLRVVAEGVETQAQLDFVSGLGCEEVQGYLFSQPLSVDEFDAYVLESRVPNAAGGTGAPKRRFN